MARSLFLCISLRTRAQGNVKKRTAARRTSEAEKIGSTGPVKSLQPSAFFLRGQGLRTGDARRPRLHAAKRPRGRFVPRLRGGASRGRPPFRTPSGGTGGIWNGPPPPTPSRSKAPRGRFVPRLRGGASRGHPPFRTPSGGTGGIGNGRLPPRLHAAKRPRGRIPRLRGGASRGRPPFRTPSGGTGEIGNGPPPPHAFTQQSAPRPVCSPASRRRFPWPSAFPHPFRRDRRNWERPASPHAFTQQSAPRPVCSPASRRRFLKVF